MQVVYSGGSTPTPSPRLQRKQYQGYGRPLMPGYVQGSSTPPFHHRTTSKETKHTSDNDSSLRDSIPAMSRSVAITCLVLNILLPGLGTFVSGLTVLCGSHLRVKGYTKQKVIWANTWVAFLQFVTAFLFLLGWIWSIVWGVTFLSISKEYYKRPAHGREKHGPDGSHKNGATHHVSRAGSSPSLTKACHLQKPIMLRSSSADQPCSKPNIVLQRAPNFSKSESSLHNHRLHIEPRTGHHHKILKRQKSAEQDELAPLNLVTRASLEQIVIVEPTNPPPPRRGVLRRDNTITSTNSTVSDADTGHITT